MKEIIGIEEITSYWDCENCGCEFASKGKTHKEIRCPECGKPVETTREK